MQQISDLHSKFALRHSQSANAENRQGKKRRKIETTAAKYNVCICYAGRP